MSIRVPEIITLQRKASYQGCCNICGRFHLEEKVVLIRITGEKSEVMKGDFSLPDDVNEHINTKCSNPECNGWVPKKLVLRE